MAGRRIITRADVETAHRTARKQIEVLQDDIVTAEAIDTAARYAIKLLDGPLERPEAPRADGVTIAQRALWRRNPRWMAPIPVAGLSPRRFSKLALIGAGGVGSNVAHLAANADMADLITLIDIAPGVAEATALDLNHASGVSGTRARAEGGTSFAMVEGADVVVVSAGRARSPGMTRADLLAINRRVMQAAGAAIAEKAPKAIVLVVTNPLDEMTFEMIRATGFSRKQVLGMAGTLDSARFRNALALAAGVAVRDVFALTLGAHGEEMAPIVSQSRIKGRALSAFLSPEKIAACVKDAVTGGGQVVALRKTGSATIAPAHSTIEVLDYLRGAKSGSTPVSVMLDGEYGLKDVVVGVPCKLGAQGLIEVEELDLTPDELANLHRAAEAIRKRLG